MPVTVKSISLWRKEVDNQVGSLAHTLEPVTKAGANLQVLMGYRYPGEGTKAAVELYPIAGKKATAVASEAGLSASSIPTLVVRQNLGRDPRRGGSWWSRQTIIGSIEQEDSGGSQPACAWSAHI
jgi:hypothetical protein